MLGMIWRRVALADLCGERVVPPRRAPLPAGRFLDLSILEWGDVLDERDRRRDFFRRRGIDRPRGAVHGFGRRLDQSLAKPPGALLGAIAPALDRQVGALSPPLPVAIAGWIVE